MRVATAFALAALGFSAPAALAQEDEGELPLVVVERPGTELTHDARVRFAPGLFATTGDEPAVIVRTNGLFLVFEGELVGAAPDTPPEAIDGVGVLVEARHVTLDELAVRGFKVGVLARRADGLNLTGVRVEDGFRQRLGSTYEREDPADWLWPHANDAHEWRTRWGAALCVEDTVGLFVSRCSARRVQNGLILDRVERATVTSNDFSFLSGWGIALWRTRQSLVASNRLDFCVRGYAHGRYNRGQDSAGLLMFEQCSDIAVERNSATHGGDGVFAFAGREALGEAPAPNERFSYERRGANHNVFDGNDFSFAAAHGLELTFSFDNIVRFNRLVGNAICGLWLGYARESLIEGNVVGANGEGAYGRERGGMNAEHAQGLLVRANVFADQPVGVRFWTDADEALAKTPWVAANGQGAADNELVDNVFERLDVALELEGAVRTTLTRNAFSDVASRIELTDAPGAPIGADERERLLAAVADGRTPRDAERLVALRDERVPGPTAPYLGREWIAIGPYGPHDWERGEPWLQPLRRAHFHSYRLLERPPGQGQSEPVARLAAGDDALLLEAFDDRDGVALGAWRVLRVPTSEPATEGRLIPYRLEIEREGHAPIVHEDALLEAHWDVAAFALTADPREDPAAFTAAAAAAKVRVVRDDLDLAFGAGGPADVLALAPDVAAAAGLGTDHFGTAASMRVALPAGRYALRTRSDDGLRVRLDGAVVIEDWTHHAPRAHEHVFEVAEAAVVALEVEHFELDGHAELSVALERRD